MDIWQYLRGKIRIQIVSADVGGCLDALGKMGVPLADIELTDPITAQLWIRSDHLQTVKTFCEKKGATVRILGQKGLWHQLKGLRSRPVLICGILFLLLVSLWLPGRILFVQVEGNGQIPTRQILEAAGKCGIVFGASRREVRSEKVKNNLLETMPSLSWAGVNTYGCTAVISVRERKDTAITTPNGHVSSIVAAMDGIVGEVTVVKGTALCAPGQAVKAGQVLISGYTDCGLLIRADRAEGEVFAQTSRSIRLLCPVKTHRRVKETTQIQKFSLVIGKKRINFANNSRIFDPFCAKIYAENYWVLPGGFVLPVAIVTERWISYETGEGTWCPDLMGAAQHYLLAQMQAGSILRMDGEVLEENDLYILDASFGCYEMIGITRNEERLSQNG